MPESAVTVRRFDDSDEHRDFPLGGSTSCSSVG